MVAKPFRKMSRASKKILHVFHSNVQLYLCKLQHLIKQNQKGTQGTRERKPLKQNCAVPQQNKNKAPQNWKRISNRGGKIYNMYCGGLHPLSRSCRQPCPYPQKMVNHNGKTTILMSVKVTEELPFCNNRHQTENQRAQKEQFFEGQKK